MIEVLTSIAIVTVMTGAVIGLISAGAHIYAKTFAHIGPSTDQTLAMTMMQRDLREATQLAKSTATWITLIPPTKDSAKLNISTPNGTTGQLQLQQDTAHPIQYFLGAATGTPTPSTTGNTLYRAVGSPVGGAFPGATVVINGISSTPSVPNPTNPSQQITTTIFAQGSDPRLLVVTFSVPVVETTRAKRTVVNHSIATQFYLRNVPPS